MAFSSFPEEILSYIAKLTAAAYYFDGQFYEEYDPWTHPNQDIWNEDDGLTALASANSRLRRICVPTLFARIVVRVRSVNVNSLEIIKLDCFYRMVAARPHIAQHITKIIDSMSQSGFYSRRHCHKCLLSRRHGTWLLREQVSSLSEILTMLPQLSSLLFVVLAKDRLVDAVNAHPSLTDVNVMYINGFNLASGSALGKVYIYSSNAQDWVRAGTQNRTLRELFSRGLNVNSLVLTRLREDEDIHTVSEMAVNHVIELAIMGLDWIRAPVLRDWLEAFVSKHPELRRLDFSGTSWAPNIMSYHDVLPLFSEVADRLRITHSHCPDRIHMAAVNSYVIERTSGSHARPQADAALAPTVWKEDWKLVSIHLRFKVCPIPMGFFPVLAETAPFLACLTLDGRLDRDANPTQHIDADSLGKSLNLFKGLVHLIISDVYLTCFASPSHSGCSAQGPPPSEEDEELLFKGFCARLKEHVPSLERIVYACVIEESGQRPKEHSWLAKVRRRLINESGDIEVYLHS